MTPSPILSSYLCILGIVLVHPTRLLSVLANSANYNSPITLIDSKGSLVRRSLALTSSRGTVTLVTSPGTSTAFESILLPGTLPFPNDEVVMMQTQKLETPSTTSKERKEDTGVVEDSEMKVGEVAPQQTDGGTTLLITSPGATLLGTSPISRGTAAGAASVVSDVIILSGILSSDLDVSSSLFAPSVGGLEDTRHGHTLTHLFLTRLMRTEDTKKQLLILALEKEDFNENKIRSELEVIFQAVVAEIGVPSVKLEDRYDVEIVVVKDEIGAKQVLDKANSEALSRCTGPIQVYAIIADAYNKMNSRVDTAIDSSSNKSSFGTMSSIAAAAFTSEPSPSVAAALLLCEEAYARNHRTARAKISSWKTRTARGLLVDKFGSIAGQLLDRTMNTYDRDTAPVSGLTGSAASYRIDLRSKLRNYIESSVTYLFEEQLKTLEKSTLDQFNAELLRKHDGALIDGGKSSGDEGVNKFYNDNAAALRSAAFAFDTTLEQLEVASLGLTKVKASREMNVKLNAALLSFPDSPAARLKGMKEISRVANKQKKINERRIDFGLDLIAMIRPDGFGNFQGFAGYQLGGNNLIVGVHNDADSPEVISQFGGSRPPFIRVQPKLKVDVEL